MKSRRTLALLFGLGLILCAASAAQAWTVLGTGDGALLGNDLTDLGDDGVEGSYSPPALGGFDAVFFASTKPGFGNRERYFNVFDNRTGGGNNKACCDGIPVVIGADFSTTLATGDFLIRLERFTLTSSNDSSNRDPDRWSIQGSTDTTTGFDGTWTDIYAKTAGGADWGGTRNEVIAYGAADGDTFLTTAGFKAFRLRATASGGGTDFALSEMEFFGTVFSPTLLGRRHRQLDHPRLARRRARRGK